MAMRHSSWQSTALWVLLLVAPAFAASDHSAGDGSVVHNERLLSPGPPGAPAPAHEERVDEPYDAFFDTDWSMALRGTYTKTRDANRFDVFLAPTLSLDRQGSRSAINVTGAAELARPQEQQIDISALRLNLSGEYRLDRVTSISGNGYVSLAQAIAGTPGLASNIVVAPQTRGGGADARLVRRFGKFNVAITGAVQREVYGETTQTGAVKLDNSDQNFWSLDTDLRIGFRATPIFEVFALAGLGREIFDRPSSEPLMTNDATDTTIKGGITGRWNEVLEATLSTGLNLRRYDEVGLGEFSTRLHDAAITFKPDPTWQIQAGFSTIVAPAGPNNPGVARIEYAANLAIGYQVNSWLGLRAGADWSSARFIGTSDTEKGYGWALGADYAVNAHTAVTADYRFDYADNSSSGVEDAQRVTLGVTVSR
ncbi:MAG: outer rane beta-barrel protein [Devosia sp.]|nr:outer rane beta-barrel protein [Devosia sp.]